MHYLLSSSKSDIYLIFNSIPRAREEVEQDPKQIRKADTRTVKTDSIVATGASAVAPKAFHLATSFPGSHSSSPPLSLGGKGCKPNPKAEADNPYLDLDYSGYQKHRI